ncbi:hypothetical protein [Porphyromonas pogonae]|uniref:hypothetical protein n=1 Tax=Porphyromonas pogonae TaxID=867595 RepID=UPI002E78690F|nr:hypothetical protein [Porphyromonas pogonae]
MSKKNNALKGVAAVLATSILIESCDMGSYMNGLDIEAMNIAIKAKDYENNSVSVPIDLKASIFLNLITTLSEEFINNPKSAEEFLNNRQEFLNARGFENVDENLIRDNQLIDMIVAFSDPIVNKAVKGQDLKLFIERLKELNLYIDKNDDSQWLMLLKEEIMNNPSLLKAISTMTGSNVDFTLPSPTPHLGAVGFTIFVITAAVVFLGAVVVNYALGATLAAGAAVAITKHALVTSGNKEDKIDKKGVGVRNTALRVWMLKNGDPTLSSILLNEQLNDKVESFINEVERAYPGSITNANREVVKNIVVSNIYLP